MQARKSALERGSFSSSQSPFSKSHIANTKTKTTNARSRSAWTFGVAIQRTPPVSFSSPPFTSSAVDSTGNSAKARYHLPSNKTATTTRLLFSLKQKIGLLFEIGDKSESASRRSLLESGKRLQRARRASTRARQLSTRRPTQARFHRRLYQSGGGARRDGRRRRRRTELRDGASLQSGTVTRAWHTLRFVRMRACPQDLFCVRSDLGNLLKSLGRLEEAKVLFFYWLYWGEGGRGVVGTQGGGGGGGVPYGP